jgi:hypothetical protein
LGVSNLDTQVIWTAVAVVAVIAAILLVVFSLRKKERKPGSISHIEGVLKHDWTRTGNIDFHVAKPDQTSSQQFILTVEEKKLTETAMGQDVVELRWRLATLDEAKEVVACWNAKQQSEVR